MARLCDASSWTRLLLEDIRFTGGRRFHEAAKRHSAWHMPSCSQCTLLVANHLTDETYGEEVYVMLGLTGGLTCR